MKNRALVVLFAFVLLAAALFIVKDRVALLVLRKTLVQAFGPAQFSAKGVSVGPASLEIRDFVLKVPSGKGALAGLAVSGERLSMRFSALGLLSRSPLAVHKADIVVREAGMSAFSGRNIRLSAIKDPSGKYLNVGLSVDSAVLRDAKIKRISGALRVFRASVEIDSLSVEAVGGVLKFSGSLDLASLPPVADLKVSADRVEMGKFMEALGMAKRVEASGFYSGDVRLVLKGHALTHLEGGLTSLTGGKFVILDTSLMDKSLAQGQAANIVIENLRNYHYDIGYITLSNEGQAARAGIQLEGKTGARHLDIVWHTPGVNRNDAGVPLSAEGDSNAL